MVRVRGHPQHVVVDQDLAGGVGTRADPDGGDLQRLGDGAGDGRGHTLDHDGEGAGVL